MGVFDEVLDPLRHDLTPDGNIGAPPDGPDTAPPLAGDTVSSDPQDIEILWPNVDAVDISPRIEEPRNPEQETEPVKTTRVMRNMVTLAPAPTGSPALLFPPDPRRVELILRAVDPGDPLSDSTVAQSTSGGPTTVTSPLAAASIVALTLPEGTYDIQWTVVMGGTLAAGDANNVALNINAGTTLATSLSPGTAGTYVQQTVRARLTGVANDLVAQVVGAGTLNSTYTVVLTATPVITYQEVQPWVWAAEQNECFNAGGTAQYLYTTDGEVRLTHHTGAVWVAVPSTAKDSVRIMGWSITR